MAVIDERETSASEYGNLGPETRSNFESHSWLGYMSVFASNVYRRRPWELRICTNDSHLDFLKSSVSFTACIHRHLALRQCLASASAVVVLPVLIWFSPHRTHALIRRVFSPILLKFLNSLSAAESERSNIPLPSSCPVVACELGFLYVEERTNVCIRLVYSWGLLPRSARCMIRAGYLQ